MASSHLRVVGGRRKARATNIKQGQLVFQCVINQANAWQPPTPREVDGLGLMGYKSFFKK